MTGTPEFENDNSNENTAGDNMKKFQITCIFMQGSHLHRLGELRWESCSTNQYRQLHWTQVHGTSHLPTWNTAVLITKHVSFNDCSFALSIQGSLSYKEHSHSVITAEEVFEVVKENKPTFRTMEVAVSDKEYVGISGNASYQIDHEIVHEGTHSYP